MQKIPDLIPCILERSGKTSAWDRGVEHLAPPARCGSLLTFIQLVAMASEIGNQLCCTKGKHPSTNLKQEASKKSLLWGLCYSGCGHGLPCCPAKGKKWCNALAGAVHRKQTHWQGGRSTLIDQSLCLPVRQELWWRLSGLTGVFLLLLSFVGAMVTLKQLFSAKKTFLYGVM